MEIPRYIDPRNYKKLFEFHHEEAENFYKNFFAHQFILRDHLAIDRTMLTNESTLLAYIRTGLAVCAAGATLIHFSNTDILRTGGVALMGVGILGFIIGGTRYHRMKKTITNIRKGKEHDQAIKNRRAMSGM